MSGGEGERRRRRESNYFHFADLNPTSVSKIESVQGKIGKATTAAADEFDLLAQSRTTEGGTSGTVRKDKEDVLAKETEFDEMAAWLKNNVSGGGRGNNSVE